MRYLAILEKDPGSLWGVWFPDFPGCVAAGATSDAALAGAAEALRDFLVDRSGKNASPPPASSLEALRADREIQEALRAGAALVAVPLILDRGRTVRANVTLDAGALQAIDDAARMRGVSRSAFMVDAALEKVRSG